MRSRCTLPCSRLPAARGPQLWYRRGLRQWRVHRARYHRCYPLNRARTKSDESPLGRSARTTALQNGSVAPPRRTARKRTHIGLEHCSPCTRRCPRDDQPLALALQWVWNRSGSPGSSRRSSIIGPPRPESLPSECDPPPLLDAFFSFRCTSCHSKVAWCIVCFSIDTATTIQRSELRRWRFWRFDE